MRQRAAALVIALGAAIAVAAGQAGRNTPGSAQAAYTQGSELARAGRHEAALPEVEKAAKLDPQNPKVHNLLGIVLTQLGRLKEANEAYNRALALAPDFYPARKNRASNAFFLKDHAFAKAEFEDLTRLQPKDPVPPMFLGLLALESADYPTAKERLLAARSLAPDDERVLLGLTRVHLLLGERPQALEAAQAVRASPKTPAAVRFDLGLLLAGFEANPEAADVFEDLWKRGRSYPVGFNLALVQYRAGRAEAALRTLEELTVPATRLGELWNLRGWILNRMGRPGQAIESFQKATAAEPAKAEHYLDLSTIFLNLRDGNAAERVIQEGLEKCPDKDRLFVQMGLLHKQNNEFDQAETWYQKALDANPGNEAAHVGFVHILLLREREKEALALLEKGLRQLSGSPLLNYVYGSLLLETGDPEDKSRIEEARRVLQRALKLNPVFANTWYRLARLYLNQGDEQKALEHFERAIALNPKNAEAMYQLSVLLSRRGEKERADQLRQALKEVHDERDRLLQELARRSATDSPSGQLVPKQEK